MTLHVWMSDALRNYRRGHLIAEADSVEEARSKLREGYRMHLAEHREWMFTSDGDVAEDMREEHDEKIAQLESDIAVEPTIIPEGIYIVTGSD